MKEIDETIREAIEKILAQTKETIMVLHNSIYSTGQNLGQYIYENIDQNLDPKDLEQVIEEIIGEEQQNSTYWNDIHAGIQTGYYTQFDKGEQS